MPDSHEWVTLVECNDVAELHALRAALEAHGVPCQIQGEHTHGILGSFHGAMVRSRVLVPRAGLVVARQLAEDIVGPFDERPPDEQAEPDELPFRRSAEAASAGDDDDEPAVDRAPSMRPKSYARLMLVACLIVAPFFGLAHIYAGRSARAGLLFVTSLVALPSAFQGATWALLVLAAVWVGDLVGGALGIAAHNRRLLAAPRLAGPAAARPMN
jgi:TM2 domain-containing membrane protein YozV